MSYRYNNAFVKPGLNTLVAPTPNYTYGLWSWGVGAYGQLGLGNTTYYSSPKQVGALTDWLSLAAGYFRGFGIKTDGTLWAWGANFSGDLGLGNTTYYSSPKQVGSLTNWSVVRCGYTHTMAIKTDGTLWVWGYGAQGQLGLGNTTSYSSPKQLGSSTWLDCDGGIYNSFAVRSDNTLWVWGQAQSNRGQCGTGTPSLVASSPIQIGSLSNWLKIAAAQYSTFAIKTDGTVWSWGYGYRGRLGLGNTSDYSSPKQIGSLTNWLNVSSTYSHVTAIKTDGTLWTWGSNTYGQLGLGNTTDYSSPKQVGALTTWTDSKGAYQNFCVALKSNSTLWAWGNNGSGWLGLGDTTSRSSPTQVGALASWGKIDAYSNSVLALQI